MFDFRTEEEVKRIKLLIIIGILAIFSVILLGKIELYREDIHWANVEKGFTEELLKDYRESNKSLEAAYKNNLKAFEHFDKMFERALTLREDFTVSLKKGTIIILPEKKVEEKK